MISHVEDLALLALRVALGGFFVLARFRWIYDPSKASTSHHAISGEPIREGSGGGRWFNEYRQAHLVWKMCACGYGGIPYMAGFVALVEIFAGLGLVFGLFTSLSALGLAIITLFATLCTWREKVARQNPVDGIDKVSCYLWLVEPHLIVMALVLVALGGGAYSLDALLAWVLS